MWPCFLQSLKPPTYPCCQWKVCITLAVSCSLNYTSKQIFCMRNRVLFTNKWLIWAASFSESKHTPLCCWTNYSYESVILKNGLKRPMGYRFESVLANTSLNQSERLLILTESLTDTVIYNIPRPLLMNLYSQGLLIQITWTLVHRSVLCLFFWFLKEVQTTAVIKTVNTISHFHT